MPGLACLPRWLLVASSFVCIALLAEASGHASTPVSIYTAASRVEMLPTDANATEVVIHGAFMFIDADGGYSDAACGYMYFRCAAGSETMCRMQWIDIRTMGAGTSQCAGFGAQNVVSTARVRAEGTALSAPDPWDLGVGVQPGSHIDGKCAPARALACAQPWSADGGAADVPLSTDAWVAVDGALSDKPAASDASAREVAGLELAGTVDGPTDRAPSSIDTAPIDEVRPPDAMPDVSVADAAVVADRPVDLPLSVPDAGGDQSTGATKDASPDVPDDGADTKSDGCSCRLGGPRAGTREHFPAGLALFAALLGAAAIRRVRR